VTLVFLGYPKPIGVNFEDLIEGKMGDSHVGLQARLMSQGLRNFAWHAQPHRHDLPVYGPSSARAP
jgi:recA bacterial DNA recombination protein